MFADKTDAYRAVLEPMLVPLADACTTQGDRRQLMATLTHVQKTATARIMIVQTRRHIVDSLTELIEARLDAECRRLHGRVTVLLPLVAAWIAEAEMGVITAWLVAENPGPVEAVADLIVAAARSCVQTCLNHDCP